MPRGGRRPGAGAPKGNFNALRSGKYSPRRAMVPLHGGRRAGAGAPQGNVNALRKGNHSHRMLMVYLYCRHHPDPRALGTLLLKAGFIDRRARRFNGDVAGLVAFLYPRIIDSSLSGTIKDNQTSAPQPVALAPSQLQSPPQTAPETAETSENAKKQRSIKCLQPPATSD